MKISVIRFFLTTSLLLVVFNEYVVYIFNSFSWPQVARYKEECTKILVVADPQILGEFKENVIARLDSDRYLRNTFSLALSHVNPDGVIFLGDLHDEGSEADDEQFERYYLRFRSIFQIKRLYSSNIPVIFVPGDNDIGGEDFEVIKANNVRRFRKYFGSDDIAVIRNIKAFKVNKLLRTYPIVEEKLPTENFTLNIAISHVPLTDVMSPFTRQVVRDVKPEFIFSAHEHQSYAMLTLKEDGKQLHYEELMHNALRNGVPTWTFKGATTTNYTVVTEIVVPTCSYRMGTPNMGYGVIVYGGKPTEITYHVLWLPSRFQSLVRYAWFSLITAFIVSINSSYIKRLYRKHYLC